MKKFTALVAIDFSKSSYVVLQKALAFTQKKDGELHIVHVVEGSFFSKKSDLNSIKSSTFSKLSKNFSSLKEENYHCVSGKVKHEISEAAKKIGADMIIMGKSGETYFLDEIFMGSHTKEIVKHSQTSILVMKSEHELEYKNILLLTDLSVDSANAIKKTAQIFPKSNIKLLNLFYLPLNKKLNTYGFNEKDVFEYQASIEKESQENIDKFLNSLDLPKSVNISTSILNSSLNSKSFKEEVNEISFDMLTLHATKNVSFFAFDILEESDVDVFIVK